MTRPTVEVTSANELREILGEPVPAVANKAKNRLHPYHQQWLAGAPLCLLATSAADGSCDVSPRGDPSGQLTLVLDDTTIVIPERPGNRRADSLHNVLDNPRVGLIYVIPGRGDTLRINGAARIVRDAPFFNQLAVQGRKPALALVVDIEAVFFHCSKAFLRSQLWQPETWNPDAVPSRPRLAQALERPNCTIEELERYYGPEYAKKLY